MRKKSTISPSEKPKVIRFIMEWIIDDYAAVDIINKTVTTWKVPEPEARMLLSEAREECAKSDELQEQILGRRIESLKKLKRGIDEKKKKSPGGITAILEVENTLIRLETLLQGIKSQKQIKADRERKRQKLNAKQEAFCLEYITERNATEAAIKAGYSKKTATEQGYRLLQNKAVKEYIDDLLEDIRKQKQLDADMALGELVALADWNIKDFLEEDMRIVDISKLPKSKTKPVVGIKSTRTITKDGEIKETTELKFVDKRAAWVDLNRHFGNFEKDNNQKALKIKVTRK